MRKMEAYRIISFFRFGCVTVRVWYHKGGYQVSIDKSKAVTTLPGRVEKIINPHPKSGEPEKAQIAVEGADHLYREIRVANAI